MFNVTSPRWQHGGHEVAGEDCNFGGIHAEVAHFFADGRNCARTRHTQSQRYNSPSVKGAAFVMGPTPVPSSPAYLLPRSTSTRPYHPTTPPPGIPRAGSRTGPPLQLLVATVIGQPGAPRRPVLRSWRPAATHPRGFWCGPGQHTLMTVSWPMKQDPGCCLGPALRPHGQGDQRKKRRYMNRAINPQPTVIRAVTPTTMTENATVKLTMMLLPLQCRTETN